jgi:hypothetical protein
MIVAFRVVRPVIRHGFTPNRQADKEGPEPKGRCDG